VAAGFVFVWAVLVGWGLGAGQLQHFDEFLTLERSLGFAQHDWLAVWSNHEPDFHKPPLQYWLAALLLEAGVEVPLAMRVWPFLFGVGTLIATGLLVRTVAPEQPWAVPAAVFLLGASPMLVELSRMAMLDNGDAFFFVLALVAVLRAAREPRWWIVAALAVGLGALQKTPVALLVCVALLPFLALHGGDPRYRPRRLCRSRWFQAGLGVAGTLCLGWALLQTLRFGQEFFDQMVRRQMIDRLAPWRPASGMVNFNLLEWAGWFTSDAFLVWGACVVGVVVATRVDRFRRNRMLMALVGYLVVYAIVMTFAPGPIYSRYLIVAAPVLAAVGAITWTGHVSRPALAALVCAGLAIASVGPSAVGWRRAYGAKREPAIALATDLKGQWATGETPVFVRPDPIHAFPQGLFMVYADPPRRVLLVKRDWGRALREIAGARRLAPPYRGIAHVDDLPEVTARLGPIERVGERDGFVIFRSAGP